jgi:hypothetical protein
LDYHRITNIDLIAVKIASMVEHGCFFIKQLKAIVCFIVGISLKYVCDLIIREVIDLKGLFDLLFIQLSFLLLAVIFQKKIGELGLELFRVSI